MATELDSTESTDALARRFDEVMVPVSLEKPVIVRGEGCWVLDAAGERYLDLVAGPGVLPLGHSHPSLVTAVDAQVRTLTQSPGKFLTSPAIEYAAELARLSPHGLTRTFFCNSGAEANEGALKLVKKDAFLRGRGAGIIAFDHSFHGRTTHALAVTGQIKYKAGLGSFLSVPGIVHVPYPYPLRMPNECTEYVLEALENVVKLRAQGGFAAAIIEPVAAVGGVLMPPEDFLPALREFCNDHDIRLIADEVFTGFGRTGAMFCCEHSGVTPDVMTLAKAIGGGLPLGAFLTTDELAGAFAERREHFTTFGANSVISCAAGLATLRASVDAKLPERSATSGELFRRALDDEIGHLPEVAEVRGRGLLIGIELADPNKSLTPRPDLAREIQQLALEERVLVSVSGSFDSVIRLSPPLTIDEEEVSLAVQVLGRAVKSALGARSVRARA